MKHYSFSLDGRKQKHFSFGNLDIHNESESESESESDSDSEIVIKRNFDSSDDSSSYSDMTYVNPLVSKWAISKPKFMKTLIRIANERGPIIKKSKISKGGFGLFADRDYRAGDKITNYGGNIIYHPTKENEKSQYLLPLDYDSNAVIDGEYNFDIIKEKGRWINDSKGSKLKTNCEFVININKPYQLVVAIDKIKKGEEFFSNYGQDYWDFDLKYSNIRKRKNIGTCVLCDKESFLKCDCNRFSYCSKKCGDKHWNTGHQYICKK